MWRSWKPLALLVGMKNGAADLGSASAAPLLGVRPREREAQAHRAYTRAFTARCL